MSKTEGFEDASEKRGTVRLLRYWLALRRFGIAPAMRDFDPRRNPVPWENCFLITLAEPPGEAIFEHIGPALWHALERPPVVPSETAEMPDFLQLHLADFDRVIASGEPAEHGGPYALPSGRSLLFRSILLPFSDMNRRACYALGAVTMRAP